MRSLFLPAMLLTHALACAAEAPKLPEPPSQLSILRSLLRASSVPLPQGASSFCKDVACGETVGDYVALLLDNGALTSEPGRSHSLQLSCEPGKANHEVVPHQIVVDGEKYWVCALTASVDPDGESPWNYELRFLLSRDDLSLDAKRMWCPGAP